MKTKNIFYFIGILFENAYRILKSFVPTIVLSIYFPKLWLNLGSAVILSLIMIGGLFYEFKLSDYFKGEKEDVKKEIS